jgi:PAS domain S-box-containing protein
VAAETEELVHEALLGEAVGHAGGAVFLTDESLRYVAANDAACRLVGCSRAELLELRADVVVERPRAQLAEAAQRVADGHVRSGSVTLRRRDGSTVPVQYVSLPTRVAGVAYVLSAVW